MQGRDGERGDEGRRARRAVLAFVLAEGSVRLDSSELQARVGGPAEVESAVKMLAANDLVVREGDEVVPTPAAVRFNELRPIAPRPSSSEGR